MPVYPPRPQPKTHEDDILSGERRLPEYRHSDAAEQREVTTGLACLLNAATGNAKSERSQAESDLPTFPVYEAQL